VVASFINSIQTAIISTVLSLVLAVPAAYGITRYKTLRPPGTRFLFALLMTAIRSQTTPVVIANFQTQFGLDWGSMTALAAVYSIPVIILTLLLQRKIVAGMTLGAVKG
jgi:ABC-type glycerol-3-phosphate transport system permease component